MKKLLVLLLLVAICFADVNLISPVNVPVSEIKSSDYEEHITYLEDTYLGEIGRGQTLDLVFSRRADKNFKWNNVEVIETSLENSVQINEDTFTVALRVPSDASKRIHDIRLKFTNDLKLRTTEIINFQIEVSDNLYSFAVPAEIEVTAGIPELIPLEIKSRSISTDELILGDFEGLPAAWSHSGTIHVKPNETRQVNFNVTALDEGIYDLEFQLSSTSGATLGRKQVDLRVYPSLKAKFEIYAEGFAFVPAILQPFYSILSWCSLMF